MTDDRPTRRKPEGASYGHDRRHERPHRYPCEWVVWNAPERRRHRDDLGPDFNRKPTP